ncbi:hypothetical protein HPB51_024801 [Rhipicephalus microplus]|uniref:Uncharacterized protein n=1 Tax=Rhipicephalus microplus TaxID=6941 RepID=A0A9J6F9D5_RHIMP|nr:hypothetical protein HPB51_024801 [Rhipicephalus microplus]
MACCSCGAITNASAAMTATRAHRFGNITAGPSSSFWKASSARLVGDSMRVRPWNPPSGPRPLLDDYAGERLCHPMTTSAGHSLASDAVHQQWCLAPAALPVRPPTVLRMLRPGPRALAIPTRDCTYINRRDIIAAFSGSGGTIAMTPTHHTPLSFVQVRFLHDCLDSDQMCLSACGFFKVNLTLLVSSIVHPSPLKDTLDEHPYMCVCVFVFCSLRSRHDPATSSGGAASFMYQTPPLSWEPSPVAEKTPTPDTSSELAVGNKV